MSLSRRHSLVALLIWIAIAVTANMAAAARSDTPLAASLPAADGTSESLAQVDRRFPGTGTDNVAYVVLRSNGALIKRDGHVYLDRVANQLRRNSRAVRSVLDMAADPLTAPIAQSTDGRAIFIQVYLRGALGSREGRAAAAAVSDVVRSQPVPAGLRLYLAGPAVTDSTHHVSLSTGSAVVLFAVVTAVTAVGVLAVVRSLITAAAVLFVSTLALTVAVPVQELLEVGTGGVPTPPELALMGAVAVGISLDIALLCRRSHADHAVGRLADRWPARRLVLAWTATVTSLCAATLLMKYPELRGIGVAASTAACVAALVTVTVTAGFADSLTRHTEPRRLAGAGWGARIRLCRIVFRHPKSAVALVGACIAIGLAVLPGHDVSMQGIGRASVHDASGDRGDAFPPGRLSAQTVVVVADHDLRNPRGLLAVDRLTHQLMALPDVRLVQSASWPAGLPWSEATLAHQLGELNREVQADGMSAGASSNSMAQLPATVARLQSSVNQLQSALDRGASGLVPLNTSLATLRANVTDIGHNADTLWHFADPIRGWMTGFSNCPGDIVCAQALKIMTPIDSMYTDMTHLDAAFSGLSGELGSATNTVTTAAGTLSAMQGALAQMTPAVNGLASTTTKVTRDLTRITAFINVMTDDLGRSGAGGFYMSQEAIDAPQYRAVRQQMFSADGHAARFFVYCDAEDFTAASARVADAIPSAVIAATKYGPLAGSRFDTIGAGSSADALRAHWWADVKLMSAIAAALIAVGSCVALRNVRAGVAVAAATLGGALAATGVVGLGGLRTLGMQIDGTTPMSVLILATTATGLDALLIARRVLEQARGELAGATTYVGGRFVIAAVLIWAVAAQAWMGVQNLFGLSGVFVAVTVWLPFTFIAFRVLMVAAVSLGCAGRESVPSRRLDSRAP